ncbi:response regulator [Pseudoxanthomonas putridarboris]|uniref:Response regulator n=1 Tax=Pseudoxanthomonas putridarboris TaxID=752605 RepID=A0ABU9IWB3_9GAMM
MVDANAMVDALAKLISAVAALAWPLVLAALLYKLYEPIRALVESGRNRKFTIKVAGNELTMEEASEQQRLILSDLQAKLAELERNIRVDPVATMDAPLVEATTAKRILWVDDNPRNNSFLVASLEDRGVHVDTALSTDQAMAAFRKKHYDIVLSDMGRPEGEKAGIDLTRQIKSIRPDTPVFIFCGSWAARHWRKEALEAGASGITSSGTSLLSLLPLDPGPPPR